MGELYRQIELPLISVLAEMEATGIQVDIYRLAEIAAKLGDQVDELEERAYELAGGPFTLGLAQAARRAAVRAARAARRPQGQDRLLDGRARARQDPRPAPDRRR